MYNTMLLLLFVLLVDGVSGAETDISVIEGDPVTLHTGLTEIINDDTILWKFGPKGSLISQIARKNNFTSVFVTDDERFRGRLQVDPITGSLTIRNTRIRHSGQYHLTISRGKTTSKIFNVTVQRVISGTDGVRSQSVSVKEGESVTLNPDKSLIHGDDLMLWVFGDKGILLAKLDVETKEISLNDADERFRGRLQLDQTGSLTITDTSTTDSGLYQLQIRGRESLQHFILTVNQPDQSGGLSAGAVAGIVIVLILAAAVLAAAAVIYHRRKISELQQQTSSVTVSEGEDITLEPNNKINKDDEIEWMFGEGKQLTSIAEIRGETGEIYTYNYAADGRFRGRLYPDQTTGSLTIRNSRTAHSGPYILQITSRSGTSVHIFFVTVNEKVTVESVKEGGSVTLNTDTEIQRDEQMLWMFGEQDDLIAQVKAGTVEMYDDAAGEIFRGRLKLDETTGSLTITDITPGHTGLYKLQIISSSRGILIKKFMVSIPLRIVRMTAGKPVHLKTDLPKIETDDEIEWRFGSENSLIAEIRGGSGETYDGPDGIFRDRLKLNDQTGDLIILNSAAKHAGHYNLKIRSSNGNTNMIYDVTRARGKSLLMKKNGKRENDSDVENALLD